MQTISKGIDLDAQSAIEGKEPLPNKEEATIPDGYEMFEGRIQKVINADRSGWWRFNDHYDRDGYCDNPGRGY